MPTYRIREYYSYCDEYIVDAPNEDAARECVDTFSGGMYPTTNVAQTAERECEDYVDTTMFEIMPDGTEELLY
jgi:hypothetical protein